MIDQIGSIHGTPVEKYDVLQVSDDGGATWLDFSTIRESDEVQISAKMVTMGGGINGHREADYRIKSGRTGQVICSRMTPVAYRLAGLLWTCDNQSWTTGTRFRITDPRIEQLAVNLLNSHRSSKEIEQILNDAGVTDPVLPSQVQAFLEAIEKGRI